MPPAKRQKKNTETMDPDVYAIDKSKKKHKHALKTSNTMPYYPSIEQLTSRFGEFGGRYIPETLVQAHEQLEEIYVKARYEREEEY